MEDEELRNPREGIRETYRVYRWVWDKLIAARGKRYAKRMLAATLFADTLMMVSPWVVGELFGALTRKNRADVLRYLAITAVILSVTYLTRYFMGRWREFTLGEQMRSIDERTNALFMEKSLGQHLRENQTLSSANVEKGRNRVLELAFMLFTDGIETVFLIAATYILLAFLSPLIAVGFGAIFGVYVYWSLYLNQRVAEICVPIDAEFRAHNRHRIERWERIERVKTFGKEREESEFMNEWFGRALSDDRKFWLWFIKHANIRQVLNLAALVGVLAYGAWRVWRGDWHIGLLVPAYTWVNQITSQIWRLGWIEHHLNWNMPSIRAMMKALTIVPDIVDAPDAAEIQRGADIRVEFDAISYTYGGELLDGKVRRVPNGVLREVSFAVEPGEVAALIGKSGAGKTTIMRLLQRGMDPDSGTIRANGTDLRGIRLDSWLHAIGYVPQQPQVLDGTIRYNLLYGLREKERAAVSDEELWEVMRELQIDFGERLYAGLETRVGRNGVKLSGGEAQRVMLGTAVLKRPRFMIIDEATSSLDSTTERAVQEGLAKALQGGAGALIIAHRLSTVRQICSKFIVLRRSDETPAGERQIEAIGHSFEELSEISPTFRRLARDQGLVLRARA